MTGPSTAAAAPGEAVAGSVSALGTALPAVTDAARAVVTVPGPVAVPELPELTAHAADAQALAAGFLATMQPATWAALAATTAWAGPAAAALDGLAAALAAGTAPTACAAAVDRLTGSGAAVAAQVSAQQQPLTDLDVASTHLGGQLAQDAAAVRTRIDLAQQDQEQLAEQAARLGAQIEQKQREQEEHAEVWGSLFGLFGSLAAEIESLADDESGLQDQIQQLERRCQDDARVVDALGAVSGPLALLGQGSAHLGGGVEALAAGWSTLLGFLSDACAVLGTAGTDPPVALVPDLTAAASALHRLAAAPTPGAPA